MRHLAGAKLAADLLTKPVTQLGAWQAFMLFMNLRAAASKAADESLETPAERRSMLAGVVAGLAAWRPLEALSKIARLVGIAAVVAHLASCWRNHKRATGQQDPLREDEPGGIFQEKKMNTRATGLQDPLREDEPNGIFQSPHEVRTSPPNRRARVGPWNGGSADALGRCRRRGRRGNGIHSPYHLKGETGGDGLLMDGGFATM